MPVTRILFARHGETTGQSSVRYFGATDVPLSDVGRAQIRRLADRVAERERPLPHVVVTSRLSRAVEAGDIIARRAGIADRRADAAWNEVDFGAWEGLTREEIVARDPDLYRRWLDRDPAFAYPGGSVSSEFRARVADAVERLFLEAEGRTVILVSHAGVVRAAMGHLFGFPASGCPSIAVDLASIHVVERAAGGERRLVVENDASHAADLVD